MFEQTAKWVGKQSGTLEIPPRHVWKAYGETFIVRIEPEIKIIKSSGEVIIVAVYGRTGPALRRDYAGAMISVLEQTFAGQDRHSFAVFDAASSKLHRAKTNMSEVILETEASFISEHLRKLFS